MPDEELKHSGTPRHSGRYPWGSGDDPYQRSVNFLGNIDKLRKQGMKDVDIAKGMGMKTTEYRKRISLSKAEAWKYESDLSLKLKDKGWSNSAIGRRIGKNESSVRLLLNASLKERKSRTAVNADYLKEEVAKSKFVDVSKGTEQFMGITEHSLKTSLAMLKEQGYVVHQIPVRQQGTGKDTNTWVLAAPGTAYGEVAKSKELIQPISRAYSEDGGLTTKPFEPPKSISVDRIFVRTAEGHGADRDGVIELRRGVSDLNLNNAKYAQVRILVNDSHYLKGMATNSDNVPDGYDIVFNTNKTKDVPVLGPKDNSVLKPIKKNPENPFGATIRDDEDLIRAQKHYIGKDGKEQLSALNIVTEEGNWRDWSKNLASQMLSKQNPLLAKRQLDLARDIAKDEFDEIMSLTNPTVKANLLEKFAGQCDSDATHMKGAALPRQATKVILPFPGMREDEIYAPHLNDGEKVVLIRYPHGAIFEIPTLTVNNKYKEARQILGQPLDAVGIHPKAAERLSGADFDGDTAIVIPINNVKIRTAAAREELVGFNNKEAYKEYPGMHVMTKHETGMEMGKISNLITDMTVKGAPPEEIVRAVRHSMVVIDAEKHRLNYQQSFVDHKIGELKEKYQGSAKSGASTLLSRASSEALVAQRKEKAVSKLTPEELADWKEGKVIWEETGKTYTKPTTNKKGEVKYTEHDRLDGISRMDQEDDAYNLVSGTRETTTKIERIYADHANSMKALANRARKEARATVDLEREPSAYITYKNEYDSLNAQLSIAKRNAPLERHAQRIAAKAVATKKFDNPNMDKDELKRLRGQELKTARDRIGAKKTSIYISDREWEAINAGAVSKTFLKDILANANPDRVRELATPREAKGMSTAKVARAKNMLSMGHDQSDVAEVLGVSVSTLINSIGVDKF